MIESKPLLIRQKEYPSGFRQTITFNPNSSATVTIKIKSKCYLSIFETENVSSWTISVNGSGTVVSNTFIASYLVNAGDSVTITIVRSNSAIRSIFTIGSKVFLTDTTTMSLLDWANNTGGDQRYVYMLKGGTTLVCIDTSLIALSNLKTVTAVVNNGTSLTITCAAHGYSNGNVISLIDVGGFTADVNAKPFTISNVTTNTFDITTTVTGTWDTLGYVAATWITNPIIATITLPAISIGWTRMAYRSVDKALYIFGIGGGSNAANCACLVITDSSNPNFNVVQNYDKTATNAYTQIAGVNLAARDIVYDSVRDRFYFTSNSGTYWVNIGSTPVLTLVSTYFNSLQNFMLYAYDSAMVFLSNTAGYDIPLDNAVQGFRNIGNRTRNGVIYTQKRGRLYYATNTPEIVAFTADASMSNIVQISGLITDTYTRVGCAVDSLDKIYFFRTNSTFSFSTRTDLQIYDIVAASKEDAYITTPGTSATALINSAAFSSYSGVVICADNSTSDGRLHFFLTTRASGKKYLGYVKASATINEFQVNKLFGL